MSQNSGNRMHNEKKCVRNCRMILQRSKKLSEFLNLQIFLALLVSLALGGSTNINLLYDQHTGQYYMPLYGKMYRIERSDHEQGFSASEESPSYNDHYGSSEATGASNEYEGHQQFQQGHQQFQGHQQQEGQYEGPSGFQPSFGGHHSDSSEQGHDFSSYGGHGGGGDGGSQEQYGGGYGGSHEAYVSGHDGEHNHVHTIPVSEHVEVTKPVAVPVYKQIGKILCRLRIVCQSLS